MDREGVVSTHERPGWCANLIAAAQLRSGERVLVVVDEPLAEQGAELAAAVANAGGRPRLELWAGERPLSQPPAGALEAAREAQLFLFLAQEPRGDEASARFKLGEAAGDGGGRGIFLGFVDDELLRGELSEPPSDLRAAAETLLAEVGGCQSVRIRGAAGTDLLLQVGGRPWLTDAGPLEAGGFANYPGGEVYVAPHRGRRGRVFSSPT